MCVMTFWDSGWSVTLSCCQRPYCVEYTRSHPNSEVKQRKARSVLGWGTAWEVLRVLLAFCFFGLEFTFESKFEFSIFAKTACWGLSTFRAWF